jgi:hypothetical protein
MSHTANTVKTVSTRPKSERPRHRAGSSRPSVDASGGHAHKTKARKKKVRVTRPWVRIVERLDYSVHASGAVMLAFLAIGMLIYEMTTLVTSSDNFFAAATAAVGDVLFVIVIVEITGNIVKRARIRSFLLIVIASVLRETLWLCACMSLNNTPAEMTHKAVELGINIAMIMGLTVSLALLPRANDEAKR